MIFKIEEIFQVIHNIPPTFFTCSAKRTMAFEFNKIKVTINFFVLRDVIEFDIITFEKYDVLTDKSNELVFSYYSEYVKVLSTFKDSCIIKHLDVFNIDELNEEESFRYQLLNSENVIFYIKIIYELNEWINTLNEKLYG